MSEEISRTKRGAFNIAAETERLIEHLQKTEIGEIVEYGELSRVINANVQREGYGYLATARKALQKDGVLFSTIRTIGIQRQGANGYVEHSEYHRGRIRRLAGRAVKTSLAMPQEQYEALDQEARLKLNMNRTILGMQREIARQPIVDKLKEPVRAAAMRLTMKETIRALMPKAS